MSLPTSLLTSMTEATGQEIGTLAAEDPILGFPADAPARQSPRPPTRRAGRVAEQRPRTALASTSAACAALMSPRACRAADRSLPSTAIPAQYVFRLRRRARTNDPGGTGYGAPGPGEVLALHTDTHAVDISLPCRRGPATPCSAASAVTTSVQADPLTAAVDALYAAAVTYGNEPQRLLRELRRAFPEVA